MKRVFNGYAVETNEQILRKGYWEDDDCDWYWDTDYHYFFERDAAEKYLRKQKKVLSPDIPFIRLRECEIVYEFGEYRYTVGDPIIEMDYTEHGVEVWKC